MEEKMKSDAEKIISDQPKESTDRMKDSLDSKTVNSGSATPNPQTGGENNSQPELFNISNEEAVRRLRNKERRIRLFGESDKVRRLRLRALQLIEELTEGGRNELMRALERKMHLEVLPKQAKDGKTDNNTKAVGSSAHPEGSSNNSDGDLEARQHSEVIVDHKKA
jgi:pre-mRNA-splicing factor 18